MRPVSLRCPALFARVDEDRSVAADLRVLGTEAQGYVATRGASSDGRALPGVGDGGDLRGGSSPRWRGVQARAGYCGRRRRIIPGCAGRPGGLSSSKNPIRLIPGLTGLPDSMAGRSSMGPDHPRLSGASSASVMRITVAAGPFSPARGFRPGVYMRLHRLGIIPVRSGLPRNRLDAGCGMNGLIEQANDHRRRAFCPGTGLRPGTSSTFGARVGFR